MKRYHLAVIILSLAFVLAAVACNTTGLTPDEIKKAKAIKDMGGELPDVATLSAEEKEVFKHVLKSTGDMSKGFVTALGENAKNSERLGKILEQFDKEPLKTIGIASRPKPENEDPNKIWEVNVGKVPTMGPDKAPVIVYEFSEPQCPFCKRGFDTVAELQKDYGDKVQFRYVMKPLPFHKEATPAGSAAYAAWAQNKFWEFMAKAFENQKDLGEESYKKWAKELKLNMPKFEADMKVEKNQAEFDRIGKIAGDLGVQGVPTFFVGKEDASGKFTGKKLRGAQKKEAFTALIDEALKGPAAPATAPTAAK